MVIVICTIFLLLIVVALIFVYSVYIINEILLMKCRVPHPVTNIFNNIVIITESVVYGEYQYEEGELEQQNFLEIQSEYDCVDNDYNSYDFNVKLWLF